MKLMLQAKESLYGMLCRLFAACLVLFMLGCGSTQDHRARQYSKDFNLLSVDEKALVKRGYVRLGMSPQAVYIALGAPLKNGGDMSMPDVDPLNLERWYYRGKLLELTDESGWLSVLFASQFESVLSANLESEYLIVDFVGGQLSRVVHRDAEGESHTLIERSLSLGN